MNAVWFCAHIIMIKWVQIHGGIAIFDLVLLSVYTRAATKSLRFIEAIC